MGSINPALFLPVQILLEINFILTSVFE